MPSRNNPNVPTSQKPKSVAVLKKKRHNTQRVSRIKKSGEAPPRTSQALRRAAAPSNKKARKLATKQLHARNRALERTIEAGEVEMRDLDVDGDGDGYEGEKKKKKKKRKSIGDAGRRHQDEVGEEEEEGEGDQMAI